MSTEIILSRVGVCVALALLFTCVRDVHAAKYVDVNWTGSQSGTAGEPFTSIRDGVGAASGSETIFIADGTYSDGVEGFSGSGQIEIPSGMTLEGGYVGHAGGSTFDWTTRTPRTSVVDLTGAGNNRGFFSQSASTPTLDGFTFQNADNSLDGGAVWLGDSFSQGGIVRNSLFQNNVTTGTGGALLFGGNNDQSILENVDFVANQATNGGGLAISVPGDQNVQFTDVSFDGNTATGRGGALHVNGGTDADIASARFTNNTAGDGGAIDNSRGTITLQRSSIIGNTATNDSAINAWGFQDVNIILENVLIADNTSTGGGYAIEVGSNAAGELTANFVTVADNAGGGAIFVHEKGSENDEELILTNSIIDGDGSGTGINTDIDGSGILTLDYNDVYDFAALYGGTASAGANSLSTDPIFVDPARNRYRPDHTSPLLSAADPGASVFVDLLGIDRPRHGGFTMGAFETPEPAMGTLLLLGLMAIGFRRRRA